MCASLAQERWSGLPRLDLIAHPGLEPLVVTLVGVFGGLHLGVLRREQRIRARPLLGPPGLEFVGIIGFAVGIADARRRDHIADDRPGTVLPQSRQSKMLLQ